MFSKHTHKISKKSLFPVRNLPHHFGVGQ